TIISPQVLTEIEAEVIFIAEEDILKTESEILDKINVGQEVYLLGFPLGLKGIKKNFPLARQGVIARNDEELLFQNQIYLDINNFPGNSGGPIIIKPSAVHLQSRKPFKKNMLLAIVSRYIAHTKTLYDNSTKPPTPKMIVEENSGIAIAIPMNVALEEIQKWIKEQKRTVEEKELKPKPIESDTDK
ncbi:MAG: trypsin-like peptidase domain-containing protein, partial [Clostridiales bacterium]|nr:trypsin-like peptidase domain-containing protein [Clostridiales bacterium]